MLSQSQTAGYSFSFPSTTAAYFFYFIFFFFSYFLFYSFICFPFFFFFMNDPSLINFLANEKKNLKNSLFLKTQIILTSSNQDNDCICFDSINRN
ncbi:hypothetical protein WN944_005249 [Citrus x changshan-huyou]|uniref:Uncharacterized protein n=1 Tax=Citrus x changshan-huyou TaxID=2935761 RepID=A0AAP0M4N6_9ROSI